MYYEMEWLSDLAIIPAFECFLAGFIWALLVCAILWFIDK